MKGAAEAASDPALAASLPSAQLVECLCQSSWDVSDRSFSDFLGIVGQVVNQGKLEAADWARLVDTLAVILHRRGSSAPARPAAAPRAPCAPCPMALPAAPKKLSAPLPHPERRLRQLGIPACGASPPHSLSSASATDQGRSWLALCPGSPIGVASAQASRLPGPRATEPCAPHAQA